MAKKLYVGNLSYETKEEGLRTEFEKVGPVTSVTIITDKFSGRSKGFGFVEMEKEEDAKKAIETLDGKEINGRQVKVNEARPMRPRDEGYKSDY
jgi:RNA recognition motif-containing protein